MRVMVSRIRKPTAAAIELSRSVPPPKLRSTEFTLAARMMPPIAAIAQELVDQITVGAVQFDTVKAGHSRIARGAPVILDNAGDFLGLKRARGDEWLHPVGRHRLTCRSNR